MGGLLLVFLLLFGRGALDRADPIGLAGGVVAIAVVLFLGWNQVLVTWRKQHVSAWVAEFRNGGEFVRLWDYHNPRPTDAMLGELHSLAIQGR
jgi:hypothetical protein